MDLPLALALTSAAIVGGAAFALVFAFSIPACQLVAERITNDR